MKAWIRAWLLRLAQLVAPAGTDVHDPDDTACPHDLPILEAAQFGELRRDAGDRFMVNLTDLVQDMLSGDWFEPTQYGDYALTVAGQRQLARLWGQDRVPPWGGAFHRCQDHGDFEQGPGDRLGCPICGVR